jgi:hypothetical protein
MTIGLLLGVQALLSPINTIIYQETGCISVVLELYPPTLVKAWFQSGDWKQGEII